MASATQARPQRLVSSANIENPTLNTNASQVKQVRKIIEGLGLDVATPDEAREILELKGGDRVAF